MSATAQTRGRQLLPSVREAGLLSEINEAENPSFCAMLRPLALARRGLVRSLHAIVLPASAPYLSSGYSRFSSSKSGSTGSQGPPRPNGRDDPAATRVRKEILEAALRHVVSHGWTDALTAGAQECGCVGWFSWHGTWFFLPSLFLNILTSRNPILFSLASWQCFSPPRG